MHFRFNTVLGFINEINFKCLRVICLISLNNNSAVDTQKVCKKLI